MRPKLNEWNDHFVTMAKEVPEDHPMKCLLVYAASKVQGERAAWEYHNSTRPSYTFNTILPDLVMGPTFNPTPGVYSTHSGFNELFLSHPRSYMMALVNPATLAVDPKITLELPVAESTELLEAFEGRSWVPFKESVIANVQDAL
ncbi:hypothetical protein K438DRAFT_1773147 [Mycena galopus ATCC 62051]|nr:hypothetical protein K438DRAFT_1773147 [Mycena galopus ATCC 62051]